MKCRSVRFDREPDGGKLERSKRTAKTSHWISSPYPSLRSTVISAPWRSIATARTPPPFDARILKGTSRWIMLDQPNEFARTRPTSSRLPQVLASGTPPIYRFRDHARAKQGGYPGTGGLEVGSRRVGGVGVLEWRLAVAERGYCGRCRQLGRVLAGGYSQLFRTGRMLGGAILHSI
jgi:hypothetical protein